MQRDYFFLFGRRWWSTGAVSWRLEVGGVSHDRKDLRQTMTPAQFISGGTIGPVRADGRPA